MSYADEREYVLVRLLRWIRGPGGTQFAHALEQALLSRTARVDSLLLGVDGEGDDDDDDEDTQKRGEKRPRDPEPDAERRVRRVIQALPPAAEGLTWDDFILMGGRDPLAHDIMGVLQAWASIDSVALHALWALVSVSRALSHMATHALIQTRAVRPYGAGLALRPPREIYYSDMLVLVPVMTVHFAQFALAAGTGLQRRGLLALSQDQLTLLASAIAVNERADLLDVFLGDLPLRGSNRHQQVLRPFLHVLVGVTLVKALHVPGGWERSPVVAWLTQWEERNGQPLNVAFFNEHGALARARWQVTPRDAFERPVVSLMAVVLGFAHFQFHMDGASDILPWYAHAVEQAVLGEDHLHEMGILTMPLVQWLQAREFPILAQHVGNRFGMEVDWDTLPISDVGFMRADVVRAVWFELRTHLTTAYRVTQWFDENVAPASEGGEPLAILEACIGAWPGFPRNLVKEQLQEALLCTALRKQDVGLTMPMVEFLCTLIPDLVFNPAFPCRAFVYKTWGQLYCAADTEETRQCYLYLTRAETERAHYAAFVLVLFLDGAEEAEPLSEEADVTLMRFIEPLLAHIGTNGPSFLLAPLARIRGATQTRAMVQAFMKKGQQ